MEPVTFARPSRDVVRTALLTFLVAPIAGVFVGVIAYAIAWGLLQKHMAPSALKVASISVGVLAGLSVPLKGWREMRHYSGCEIRIHDDRIVRRDGDRAIVMQVDDIVEVRLRWAIGDFEVRLTSPTQMLVLPVDIAPFSIARGAIEAGPLARIANRISGLSSGQSLFVTQGAVAAGALLLLATALPLFGTFLILTIHGAGEGFRLVRLAVVSWRLGWQGLWGGFRMTPQGLIPSGGAAPTSIPWGDLDSLDESEYGFVARASNGRRVRCSWLSTNAWPARMLIGRRMAGTVSELGLREVDQR